MKARLGVGLLVIIVVVLTGCSGGAGAGSNAGATGATGTAGARSGGQQQARTVWLEYARCVRAHGFPAFPDPRIDGQGHADFGRSPQIKSAGQQAQAACGGILSHLPATAQGDSPVTPGMLHEEQLFAACVRRHGLTDWPDPRPDGSFPLHGTPYVSLRKSPAEVAAFAACRQYDNFGGVKG
jgi:hypothetical protein